MRLTHSSKHSPIWRYVLQLFYYLLLSSPFVVIARIALQNPHLDFYYFYYALHLVWRHLPVGAMYNLPAEQAWFLQHGLPVYPFDQYVYPPQFAVLFSWLASFKLPFATEVWSSFSFLAYISGVLMLSSVTNVTRQFVPRILLYITALLNFPFWWDLTIGNANSLIFFLVSAALYLRYHKRLPWLAGIPLGFAIVMKVTPAVMLGYFLLRREWRLLSSTLITISLATAVTFFTIGASPITYYIMHLSELSRTSMQNGNAPYNSSPLGLLGYLKDHQAFSFSQTTIHAIYVTYVILLATLVTVVMLWSVRNPKHEIRPELALGVLTILVFSPLIEGPHMMLAWISAWLLFSSWWEQNFTSSRPQRRNLWGKTAILLLFVIVVAVLSPLGWIWRPVFVWEYFLVLCILVVLAIVMMSKNTEPVSQDANSSLSGNQNSLSRPHRLNR